MPKTRPPNPPQLRPAHRAGPDGAHAGGVGRQFEPSAQPIRNWLRQADWDDGRRADGATTAEREEVCRLRRDVKVLREGKPGTAPASTVSTTGPRRRISGGETRACSRPLAARNSRCSTSASTAFPSTARSRWPGSASGPWPCCPPPPDTARPAEGPPSPCASRARRTAASGPRRSRRVWAVEGRAEGPPPRTPVTL